VAGTSSRCSRGIATELQDNQSVLRRRAGEPVDEVVDLVTRAVRRVARFGGLGGCGVAAGDQRDDRSKTASEKYFARTHGSVIVAELVKILDNSAQAPIIAMLESSI